MNTQPFMWPFNLFAPGNLNQPILPGWSFGNVSLNYAGNAEIEKDVVEKVASFGKQLGIITDAVLALADGKPKNDKAIARLRDLAAKTEQVKNQNRPRSPTRRAARCSGSKRPSPRSPGGSPRSSQS